MSKGVMKNESTARPWKSDTFPLANGGPSVKLPRPDYEIACIAVNNHDTLTARVAELEAALEGAISLIEMKLNDQLDALGESIVRRNKEFASLTARVAELREALEGVSLSRLTDGSLCFCLRGHRERYAEHSDSCRIARAALKGGE